MKKLILALYVVTLSATTWAACSTHTFSQNGKYVVCTTCCYNGGNCTTTCY